MSRLQTGRVVVVTGGAAGIGRAHALELARQGARVVVNDVAAPDEVVDELRSLGAEAIGVRADVSDWDDAERLVRTAVEELGDLHAVVNNAGIIRDKMLVTMTPDEWDPVLRVHLRSTFCVTRHAASYWRERSKAGAPVAHPRIVNTTSPSGLFGNVGQSNYGAAKAGIAAFTVIVADELSRLGVGVNAVAPTALTGMTDGLESYVDAVREQSEQSGFDVGSPANIAPVVTWLASPASEGITGRVLTVKGGEISVAETWVKGPTATNDGPWDTAALSEVVPSLVAAARPNTAMNGRTRG